MVDGRASATPQALLRIADLVVHYGSIPALRGVSLDAHAGEMVAVVGPNGAGKSTLLSAIAGVVRPSSGSIVFKDRAVDGRIEATVRRGIALVPEGRHVFARLTVLDNLRLGATVRRDAAVTADIDRFFDLFPILGRRRSQPAGQLSGGEQQQLVIARALLSRPTLLLVDEPSLGLAPLVIEEVYRMIGKVRDEGTAVLVVEQSAARALKAADRVFVLNTGLVRLSGTGAALQRNPDFEAAYFGLPGANGDARP